MYSENNTQKQVGSCQTYNVERAGQINPSAAVVNNNNIVKEATVYYSSNPTRMDIYFRKLREEIENNTTQEIIDDLREYKTKLDGKKGLKEKLTDGGFSSRDIDWAMRRKEQYAKKATKYECYPSAQEINLLLFGEIKAKFDSYVFPRIKQGETIGTIMQLINEVIVSPIMKMLNENGAHDEDLHYTSDHIYGMIYYLTGMCHLNWIDYDNV